MDFKSTLNFPDPEFSIPMKADLPSREPIIQAKWDAMETPGSDRKGIYHRIQEARIGAPTFVLHDGPPYTNSPIHIGTAMNKILKDFVVKSRTLLGYRAPYVPGFDNHGLPIEQAVMKIFAEKKEHPDVVTLRQACRAHAAKYLDLQASQFRRLGVFGLWEKPYATMNYRFEAEIVRVFKRLVEGGFVYKGLRPTLWSPTQRTALADTEIVYQDHTSKAIYVRFPVRSAEMLSDFPNLYTVIWTTTPWTIPANLAVAFHPEFTYAVVEVGDAQYLLLEDLVAKTAEKCGWSNYEIVHRVLGRDLAGATFKHPIFDRDSIVVLADYVTTEDGTGVVHTAPGHGRDDFFTGMKYGLPILCPVDEKGVLTEEAGEFAGVSYKDCDVVVVNRLQEVGNLLSVSDYQHSYPHSERDGKPVIFRATEQWFVALDHAGLRDNAMESIRHVKWYPETGYSRISAMVANRPDWCISRQRPWGVGIPIFYGKTSREPVMDVEAIEAVAKLVESEGSDAWFAKDPSEILPAGYKHPVTGETEFVKETDVLDVWFDSGSTNLAVLEGNVEPEWREPWPADLYLEGSDQHRGWFNSSLIIGVGTRNTAPYRAVVTHGFVMDKNMMKMSKRLGNVIDPVEVCDKFGADILRYWTASVDWANDVPCYDELLKQIGEQYRTVRNTLRFLLGNLSDFTDADAAIVNDIDQWVIEQTESLVADCADAYLTYDFGRVISGVHNFCAKELSKFYFEAIKDRMYCDGKDWVTRRSHQKACHTVLLHLVRLLAPILMHTAEEVYERIPAVTKLASVHMETLTIPTQERLEEIAASPIQNRFGALLTERADCFAEFEKWKQTADVKDSQEVIVTVSNSADQLQALREFEPYELANLYKMSWVELVEGPEGFSFRPSEYPKCERSRIRRPDVAEVNGHMVTKRDARAMGW